VKKKVLRYSIVLILVIALNLILLSSNVIAPPSCFLPGTLITMGDGSKKVIEDVRVGEQVLSFNEETQELVVSEVNKIQSPIRADYMIMTFENGIKLNLTRDHPMYTKTKNYIGWASKQPEKTLIDYGVYAEELEVGDYILNASKEWVQIINLEYVNETVQTYDLEHISNTNTYFADGFLAHNRNHPRPRLPPPECVSGTTQRQSCGDCGRKTRTCVAGRWGSFGSCSGQGVCTPGDTQTQTCDRNGFQTCTNSCEFPPPGVCQGENPFCSLSIDCGQQKLVCRSGYLSYKGS